MSQGPSGALVGLAHLAGAVSDMTNDILTTSTLLGSSGSGAALIAPEPSVSRRDQ